MVKWPWRRAAGESETTESTDDQHAEAVVVCRVQDATLAVYEDRIVIERARRSRFDDVTVPLTEVVGVDYDEGLTIGYLQLERTGVTPDAGGLLSDPVNPQTVHFGRGDRDCARRARDAILERATG
ncbi:hypothetical protein [Halosegnis sp.]|uniref:hypothetical protein n=1 Tax=Halosegnis sp. TaxID=2864959 RepID=UPI0035D3EB90